MPVASCKRHDFAPWIYYRDILIRLQAMLLSVSEEGFHPAFPPLVYRLTIFPHLLTSPAGRLPPTAGRLRSMQPKSVCIS
jgi:hypothetical protein